MSSTHSSNDHQTAGMMRLSTPLVELAWKQQSLREQLEAKKPNSPLKDTRSGAGDSGFFRKAIAALMQSIPVLASRGLANFKEAKPHGGGSQPGSPGSPPTENQHLESTSNEDFYKEAIICIHKVDSNPSPTRLFPTSDGAIARSMQMKKVVDTKSA